MEGFQSLLVVLIIVCYLSGAVTNAGVAESKENVKNTNAGDASEIDTSCGCSSANRQTSADTKSKCESDFTDCDTVSSAKNPAQDAAKNSFVSTANSSPYPRTNQMVFIKGGTFIMGTDNQILVADGEGPARKVTLDSFYLDVHETSNAEFERFVNATSYITEVEYRLWQYVSKLGLIEYHSMRK